MRLICSAQWDATSAPHLAQYHPQYGVEIRQSPNSVYRPLNALFAGPEIFVRRLHLPEDTVKLWVTLNWSKLQAVVNLYQLSFPPYAHNRDASLAMMEFVTAQWTSAYEDANAVHMDWVPIALGWTTGKEIPLSWDNIQLPRPTMRAKLGMGNGQVCIINFLVNI